MLRNIRPRWRHGLPLVAILAALIIVAAGSQPAGLQAAPGQDTSGWTTYANGDDIWDLAFEGDTLVWAATRGGGVVRWDLADLAHPTATQFLAPQSGLPGNVVRAVVVDNRNFKWFATNKGLARLAPNGDWLVLTQASTNGRLPADTLTALALQGNTLWVGGQQTWSPNDHKWLGGGFARLDIASDTPTILNTWSTASHNDALPSDNVTDIAVDLTTNDVWLTFRPGLESIDPTPDRPNTFFRDRYGGIAVVHPDLAIDKFQRPDGDPNAFPKYPSFLSVAIDPQGLKWFGSGNLTQGGNGFEVLKGNSPASAQWKAFTAPGSAVASGLTLMPSLPTGANRILHITTGLNNQMWLSLAADTPNLDRGEGLGVCRLTWDGGFDSTNVPVCALYNTDGGTTGQKIPGNLVRALILDPARQLGYFGTSARLAEVGTVAYSQGTEGHGIGALSFAPPKTTVLSTAALGLTPRSNHISAIALKSDGSVWVGAAYPTSPGEWTGSGLNFLDTQGKWHPYPIGDSSTGRVSSAVSSLLFDGMGRLWVGLLRDQLPEGQIIKGGVAIDNPPWEIIDPGPALPGESISSLARQGSQIFVGTGNRWPEPHGMPTVSGGLGVYDTATSAWGTPIQAPTIIANEITDLSSNGDQVWVANTSPTNPGESQTGGASRLASSAWTNFVASQNGLTLSAGDARSAYYASDGTAWVGGYSADPPKSLDPFLANAVINWLPSGQGTWQNAKFTDEGWASAIAYRQKGGGTPWVGLSRGGQDVEDFPAKVFPAGQGNQYYAQGGIRVLVNGEWRTFTPQNSPLTSGHITALVVDSNDNLWIGTTLGLQKYTGDVPSKETAPTATPTPTPSATSTPRPTPATPAAMTPATGGNAPTLTPVVPQPTATPFGGTASPPPEIPEASTILLLGGGLAGLLGYLRYRIRRQRP